MLYYNEVKTKGEYIMNNNLFGKKAKFASLLAIASLIGIQASQATTEIKCPVPSSIKQDDHHEGDLFYNYSANTTGDRTIIMKSENELNKMNLPKVTFVGAVLLPDGKTFQCFYAEGGRQIRLQAEDAGLKDCTVQNPNPYPPFNVDTTYLSCP